MDNEGAQQPNADPNVDVAAAVDENVDQYFDDGGETFLPADHVSSISRSHRRPIKQELAASISKFELWR